MLEVQDLNVYYGAIHALKGINFYLNRGEIVALIGANGAGKSTTLNTISGLMRSRTGHIFFQDDEITQTLSEEIVRKGVIQVPEGRKIFAIQILRERGCHSGCLTRLRSWTVTTYGVFSIRGATLFVK